MTVLFEKPATGGSAAVLSDRYCPVLHATFAASAAIARIESLQQRLGINLSIAAAVHVGPVVLGTAGVIGQAWGAYGRGVSDASAMASSSASLVRPDRSSLALSGKAIRASLANDE